MLATYTPTELVGFVFYLFKSRQEDELWDIWLAKDIDKPFSEFKNENMSKQFKPKTHVITEQEEQEVYDFTDQFIKPTN